MPGQFLYKGITITVNHSGHFYFAIGSEGQIVWADTLAAAKARIDRIERAQRTTVDLDLPILSWSGGKHILKKIHRGTGHWISAPKVDGYLRSFGFADTEANQQLLSYYLDLQKRCDNVRAELQKRQLRLEGSYYGLDRQEGIAAFESSVAEEYKAALESQNEKLDIHHLEALERLGSDSDWKCQA